MAKVIFYVVVCWGSNLKVRGIGRLGKLIRTTGCVVGVELGEGFCPNFFQLFPPTHFTVCRPDRGACSARLWSTSVFHRAPREILCASGLQTRLCVTFNGAQRSPHTPCAETWCHLLLCSVKTFQLSCKWRAVTSRLNCCHCVWYSPPLTNHCCYQMTSQDGTSADTDSSIILLTNSSVNDHFAPVLTARLGGKRSDPGMKPEFNFSRLCAPSRYTFNEKWKLVILDTSSVNSQATNGVPF